MRSCLLTTHFAHAAACLSATLQPSSAMTMVRVVGLHAKALSRVSVSLLSTQHAVLALLCAYIQSSPHAGVWFASRGSAGGLTVAEQRDLLQRAQEEVDAAEPKAEVDSGASTLPAAVRIMPLGEDRRGALYWKLHCSPILAGAWPLSIIFKEPR